MKLAYNDKKNGSKMNPTRLKKACAKLCKKMGNWTFWLYPGLTQAHLSQALHPKTWPVGGKRAFLLPKSIYIFSENLQMYLSRVDKKGCTALKNGFTFPQKNLQRILLFLLNGKNLTYINAAYPS